MWNVISGVVDQHALDGFFSVFASRVGAETSAVPTVAEPAMTPARQPLALTIFPQFAAACHSLVAFDLTMP